MAWNQTLRSLYPKGETSSFWVSDKAFIDTVMFYFEVSPRAIVYGVVLSVDLCEFAPFLPMGFSQVLTASPWGRWREVLTLLPSTKALLATTGTVGRQRGDTAPRVARGNHKPPLLPVGTWKGEVKGQEVSVTSPASPHTQNHSSHWTSSGKTKEAIKNLAL